MFMLVMISTYHCLLSVRLHGIYFELMNTLIKMLAIYIYFFIFFYVLCPINVHASFRCSICGLCVKYNLVL